MDGAGSWQVMLLGTVDRQIGRQNEDGQTGTSAGLAPWMRGGER